VREGEFFFGILFAFEGGVGVSVENW